MPLADGKMPGITITTIDMKRFLLAITLVVSMSPYSLVQNYELILISVLHNQRKVFINAEKVVISCRIASFCRQ